MLCEFSEEDILTSTAPSCNIAPVPTFVTSSGTTGPT